ncbi:MAG: hypothetical protein N3G20_03425, partial [Verrucomicrobiae bacterium]|nr:hypothetical protein [Verrucomicrobiae bacterium]
EVKVIPVDAMKTNKNPRPVWHLVSKSGSPPLKGLAYGQPIRGMKSVLDKVGAEPLQPGITYRLLIRAGRARGELDFRVEPAPLERN